MTTAAQLLAELQAGGIELQPHGDALRFRPRERVTPDVLQALQAHKPELLALLAGGTQDGRPDLQAHGADEHHDHDHHGDLGHEVDDARDHHGDGPQDLQPQDADLAGWSEYSTPDGRRGIVRDDLADIAIIDLPPPCSGCGGLERWQDMAGTWRCPVCDPVPMAAERLRQRVALARQRHPVVRDAGPQDLPDRQLPPWPRAVPVGILAAPVPMCRDCGIVPVVGGQPGRPVGLCFRCWNKRP